MILIRRNIEQIAYVWLWERNTSDSSTQNFDKIAIWHLGEPLVSGRPLNCKTDCTKSDCCSPGSSCSKLETSWLEPLFSQELWILKCTQNSHQQKRYVVERILWRNLCDPKKGEWIGVTKIHWDQCEESVDNLKDITSPFFQFSHKQRSVFWTSTICTFPSKYHPLCFGSEGSKNTFAPSRKHCISLTSTRETLLLYTAYSS